MSNFARGPARQSICLNVLTRCPKSVYFSVERASATGTGPRHVKAGDPLANDSYRNRRPAEFGRAAAVRAAVSRRARAGRPELLDAIRSGKSDHFSWHVQLLRARTRLARRPHSLPARKGVPIVGAMPCAA